MTWQEIQTTQALCAAHPDRVKGLFHELDLARPGLKDVRMAYEHGQLSTACDLLIEYFKENTQSAWLRVPRPDPSQERDPRVEDLLKDTFTIQCVVHQQPRREDGGLDWGHHGPHDDHEWGWLLNRHSHFNRLLQAWRQTGNPVYAKCFDEHIRDWVIANPYRAEQTRSAQWRVLEVGLRISSSWPNAFFGFQHAKEFSPAARILMLSSIVDHVDSCLKFHAPEGNHVLMEMSGIANVCFCLPELKSAKAWLDYAVKIMIQEITNQVYPDGTQTEMTSHYHHVSLHNFEKLALLAERAHRHLPEQYNKVIIAMWDYLARSMRPDGYGVMNNDSDRNLNKTIILGAAERYQRPDWQYIATNGAEGEQPKGAGEPSAFFPWAGQLIMRDSWRADAHWGFLDIGPWGIGHQHNDKLHLSVAAYGRDLLVDSGRFAYSGKISKEFRRPYACHSAGHNVILVDGKGQGPGPLKAKEPLGDAHFSLQEPFDFAWGDMDCFEDVDGEIRHARGVVYVRGGYWVVVDRIETDRPRRLETLWHWHPLCSVQTDGNQVRSHNEGQGNLGIVPVGPIDWQLDLIKGQKEPRLQGWYSEVYNKFEPNPTAVYSADVASSTLFGWVLVPAKGTVPELKASITSQDDDALTIRVEVPGQPCREIRVSVSVRNSPLVRIVS